MKNKKAIFVLFGIAIIFATIITGLLSKFRFKSIVFHKIVYPGNMPTTYSIDPIVLISTISTILFIFFLFIRWIILRLFK